MMELALVVLFGLGVAMAAYAWTAENTWPITGTALDRIGPGRWFVQINNHTDVYLARVDADGQVGNGYDFSPDPELVVHFDALFGKLPE